MDGTEEVELGFSGVLQDLIGMVIAQPWQIQDEIMEMLSQSRMLEDFGQMESCFQDFQ